MIDNKKEQERAELHRTIWSIANDLRGSVDGWDFKNYVLVMLFYRYISENLTNYINAGEHEAGDADYFTRLVPNTEIAENGYNLSVSTYVEQEDTREVIDIAVLNAEIAEIVARENVLRAEIDKIIAEIEV